MKKEDFYNVPKYAGVYLFTNNITSKSYIGSATKVRQQMIKYLNCINDPDNHESFYDEIRNTGLENFEFKLLMKWTDALSARTQYYMDLFLKQYINEHDVLVI